MLRIRILSIGKLKKGPLNDLKEDYSSRIRWPLEICEIESKQTNPKLMNEDENQKIADFIEPGSYVIAMDEKGKTKGSIEFAKHIKKLEEQGQQNIIFIIGGADGLSEQIRSKASLLLSYGKQTWPHMLARIMLLEQIYRAQQILSGHPYHRE